MLELFVAGSLRELLPDEHVLVRVDRVLDLGWLRGRLGGQDRERPMPSPPRHPGQTWIPAAARSAIPRWAFFNRSVPKMRSASVGVAHRYAEATGTPRHSPKMQTL